MGQANNNQRFRRRVVFLVGLLLVVLTSCGFGLRTLSNNAIQPFVLPGATDVVVTRQNLRSQIVVYRTDLPSITWRDQLAHQLARDDWRSRDYNFGYTKRFSVSWYRRTTAIGPITIQESAIIGGDPNDPQIVIVRLERDVTFPTWEW